MKTFMGKFVAILFYLAILLYSVKFDIRNLWNTKEVLLMIVGVLILTAASCKKGIKAGEVKSLAGANAMIAAYIITFIGLYVNLTTKIVSADEAIRMIALNCRPLLYGFILYVVLKQDKEPDIDTKGRKEDLSLEAEAAEEYFRKKGLTKRETEIALLAREGFSNGEIGDKLFISEATVKKHMSNIFEKLGLKNREQLKQL